MKCLLSILLFVPFLVDSTPLGAPKLACESLTPQHGLPRPGPSPYHLQLAQATVKQGQEVSISLKSDPSSPFKGFLVQVRPKPEVYQPLGRFNEPETMDCVHDADSVTHSDPQEKESVELKWVAPDDYVGKAYVVAVVARNLTHYWKDIVQEIEITK